MLSTDSGDSSDPLREGTGQGHRIGEGRPCGRQRNRAGTGGHRHRYTSSQRLRSCRPSETSFGPGWTGRRAPGLPRPAMPSPHRYQRRPARPRRAGWPLGHRRRPIPAARSRAHRHFVSTADGGAGRNHRHRRAAFDAACPALLDSRPPVGHQRVHTRFRGASAPRRPSRRRPRKTAHVCSSAPPHKSHACWRRISAILAGCRCSRHEPSPEPETRLLDASPASDSRVPPGGPVPGRTCAHRRADGAGHAVLGQSQPDGA
jgi:hypothetical protein